MSGILDALVFGIRTLFDPDGVQAERRPTMKFDGATLTDDAGNRKTTVEIDAGTGVADGADGELQTSDGGTTHDAATNVTAADGYVAIGPTPAVHGQLRAAYSAGNAIWVKKDSAAGERDLFRHNTDATDIGDDNVPTVFRGSAIVLGTSEGNPALRIEEDRLIGILPWLGAGNMHTRPIHGSVDVDILDSDYYSAPAEWTYRDVRITNGTPMTMLQTYHLRNVLASPTDDYACFVRNDNGAGFAVRLDTHAGGGTTVDIADGYGAWVWVTATGVRRMTADAAA